jgi:hypothetical protein
MDASILETDGGVNTRDGGQVTVGLLQIVMDAEEAGEVGGGFIRIKYKCII